MAKAKQTIQGKAFEYACLNAISHKLEKENNLLLHSKLPQA